VISRSCYLDGDLRLRDCNGAGGGASVYFASGASVVTTSNSFSFGGASIGSADLSAYAGTRDLLHH